MKNVVLAAALASSLAACAMPEIPPDVHVHELPAAVIANIGRATHLDGLQATYWINGPFCEVVVPPPRGWRDPLYACLLRHEMRHCHEGAWHGDRKVGCASDGTEVES
jgi:hypothetical protein